MDKPNVLITGSASGIGLAAAKRFSELGCNVYGIDISAVPQVGIRSFSADITDPDALADIKARLAEEGVKLRVIINAAGRHMMASLVESDFSKMKSIVDVNLMGAMLVNRLFHEMLESSGRIVIVTSEVAPLDPMPFNGLYNISKTALDTYSQALRQELNLIGQKVITIRPGAVETPLSHASVSAAAKLADGTVLYKRQAKGFAVLTDKFKGKTITPEAIAEVICKAALTPRPRLIYSKHRNPALIMLSLLPKRLQCLAVKLILAIF